MVCKSHKRGSSTPSKAGALGFGRQRPGFTPSRWEPSIISWRWKTLQTGSVMAVHGAGCKCLRVHPVPYCAARHESYSVSGCRQTNGRGALDQLEAHTPSREPPSPGGPQLRTVHPKGTAAGEGGHTARGPSGR